MIFVVFNAEQQGVRNDQQHDELVESLVSYDPDNALSEPVVLGEAINGLLSENEFLVMVVEDAVWVDHFLFFFAESV